MRKYHSLEIWKRSHQFTLDVYGLTRSFPKEELFVLTSQLRRSASSVPTNIAEGCGRKSNTELSRFLQIALGSAAESEYQILLAKDLHYINDASFKKMNSEITEIKKMINAFIQHLPPNSKT
jgi:four helix bundle protein